MGVQFAQSELDSMQEWQSAGKTPVEIHQRRAASRRRRSKPEPDLTTVRRALKGTTCTRSRVDTRGRTKVLSSPDLKALDRARVRLIAKVDIERGLGATSRWVVQSRIHPTCQFAPTATLPPNRSTTYKHDERKHKNITDATSSPRQYLVASGPANGSQTRILVQTVVHAVLELMAPLQTVNAYKKV